MEDDEVCSQDPYFEVLSPTSPADDHTHPIAAPPAAEHETTVPSPTLYDGSPSPVLTEAPTIFPPGSPEPWILMVSLSFHALDRLHPMIISCRSYICTYPRGIAYVFVSLKVMLLGLDVWDIKHLLRQCLEIVSLRFCSIPLVPQVGEPPMCEDEVPTVPYASPTVLADETTEDDVDKRPMSDDEMLRMYPLASESEEESEETAVDPDQVVQFLLEADLINFDDVPPESAAPDHLVGTDLVEVEVEVAPEEGTAEGSAHNSPMSHNPSMPHSPALPEATPNEQAEEWRNPRYQGYFTSRRDFELQVYGRRQRRGGKRKHWHPWHH